ncbi:hypothetical protein CC78DRAFT_259369 [Lojkania enalia]|uniref:Uncharacterized protein n=1 Tax=Lojkania enalia TaxID=147567 RepID=A0A9P4KAB2_9PLEO|nr:hypothetical protein CC78DRAFT_259369 [Didymosphaeria enalia]
MPRDGMDGRTWFAARGRHPTTLGGQPAECCWPVRQAQSTKHRRWAFERDASQTRPHIGLCPRAPTARRSRVAFVIRGGGGGGGGRGFMLQQPSPAVAGAACREPPDVPMSALIFTAGPLCRIFGLRLHCRTRRLRQLYKLHLCATPVDALPLRRTTLRCPPPALRPSRAHCQPGALPRGRRQGYGPLNRGSEVVGKLSLHTAFPPLTPSIPSYSPIHLTFSYIT